MITQILLYDAQKLESVELDDFPYPLQKFDWTYGIIGDTIQKPFSAGRYDTRQSVGSMEITCEGQIVEDTTSNYWASRKALVAKILPPQDQPITEWRHSYLEVTFDDNSVYFADVQLSSFSLPIEATGSPTVSPFQFNWTCNLGYWSEIGSGAVALL